MDILGKRLTDKGEAIPTRITIMPQELFEQLNQDDLDALAIAIGMPVDECPHCGFVKFKVKNKSALDKTEKEPIKFEDVCEFNKAKIYQRIFDLVNSGFVRHFNSDKLEDTMEIARRITDAVCNLTEWSKSRVKIPEKIDLYYVTVNPGDLDKLRDTINALIDWAHGVEERL